MLERISKVNDIKKLNMEECRILADEIRSFLLEKVSRTGGHLASNLGAVELTIALHLVFDPSKDRIIWDVGHQSYTHKLLTGRKEGFENLRQYKGMSGFPKRGESICDAFETGHSTTSISAGIGYVCAREILHEDYRVVSVIGDGSFTGGMAYEALNNAASLEKNFIIVLNDNNMSISENVGGMSRYLSKFRTAKPYTDLKRGVTNRLQQIPGAGNAAIKSIRKTKNSIKSLFIPGMFFEDMGITYLGPVDGHNIEQICDTLREAERIEGPVIVHVLTEKGKGYAPAQKHPSKFHGVGAFNVSTGMSLGAKKETYQDVFGKIICREAENHPEIVAITAAMSDGTGLNRFRKLYPDRFFDVGIAEEHAVTFAAGLAAGGLHPVFAVYSSFLQRGFDQIIHDVAMQNLPVIFAIDRAGLVGNDGETHQGAFDLSYLSCIPNMQVLTPKNKWELEAMFRYALTCTGPVAIRYPRGAAGTLHEEFLTPIETGKAEMIFEEDSMAILSAGHMYDEAYHAWEEIHASGYRCSLVNARFVKPMDHEMIRRISERHKMLVTLEENVAAGGFGEQVAAFVKKEELPMKVIRISLPDQFIEQGNVSELREVLGMDAKSIARRMIDEYKKIQEIV